MELPRKKLRNSNIDYSRSGAYFLTLCAHDRQMLFGNRPLIPKEWYKETGRFQYINNDVGNELSPSTVGTTLRGCPWVCGMIEKWLHEIPRKFKNIELIDDYSVSNNYEEPFVENYIIKKEQTRVENNIKAASFLYDFNTDEMIQKSRAKIKQDVVNYQPHIKDFEEVVDISDVKEDKIEKEEDIVEILPNGNVRYRDVDGSITTRLATPFDKERFNSKYDSVSLEQRGNADIFNSKDVDVKEDSIKISSDCSVIFEKNEDGSYMQTYKFGDMLGQGMKITEEQYKQFKLDAKGLNKGKEKEKEYELDM